MGPPASKPVHSVSDFETSATSRVDKCDNGTVRLFGMFVPTSLVPVWSQYVSDAHRIMDRRGMIFAIDICRRNMPQMKNWASFEGPIFFGAIAVKTEIAPKLSAQMQSLFLPIKQ